MVVTAVAEFYRVLRPCELSGGMRQPGEIISSERFFPGRAATLVEMRYIEPVHVADLPEGYLVATEVVDTALELPEGKASWDDVHISTLRKLANDNSIELGDAKTKADILAKMGVA